VTTPASRRCAHSEPNVVGELTEPRDVVAVAVAHPGVCDQDQILDAVEALAVQSGPAAVTIRAVGAAIGVSNGAVYHTFGSRAGLAGRAWPRAGHQFLSAQTDLIDATLGAPDGSGVAAVVAAADAPAVFAERYPASSQLLLTVRREELLGAETPPEIATQLDELDTLLVACMVRLARALWSRKDAAAVDVITACIVDLPTAILLHRNRINDPDARERLRAAVRADWPSVRLKCDGEDETILPEKEGKETDDTDTQLGRQDRRRQLR
jgi:AcrR family transcriptional regulator